MLEHESPIDWFSFEPRVAGDHFVRVSSTGKDRCGDLWSGFAPSRNNDQRYDRTGAGDEDVQVFGPIGVSEEEIGQTRSFYIACEALIWDTAYSVAVVAPGSDPASEALTEAPTSDPGSVDIAGLKPDEDAFEDRVEAEQTIENIMEAMLGARRAADDAVEAEAAGEGFSWWWLGFPWWLILPWWLGFPWWWLLIFITLGGLGCWRLDRRSEPQQDTS